MGVAGCGVVHSSCIGKDSVTAALGHPYFLTFNYDGPKEIVNYLFSKDGVTLDGDNTRIFPDMNRIYFTEVIELDAGTYTLVVLGSEILYNETVRLCGKQFMLCKLFPCINSIIMISIRAGLRGRQSRQPPRAPGFRGPPNAKNRAPACSYQKIEIP